MTVKIINPLNYAGWDDLILTQKEVTLFHSSHWARVLCSAYNYKPLYFIVKDNNELLAAVPVMEVDSFITGKRGVSLPFTDFCPPLINGKAQNTEIWNTIRAFGRKAGWKYFEIRGGEDNNGYLSVSSKCYEHVFNFSTGGQGAYNHIRDSCIRNIRKAQKNGVKVEFCDSLESVRQFYQLNLITRKRHGFPPQPFSFFKNIYQYVIKKNYGIVFLAYYEGKAVAGAICMHFGNKAMYKFAASDKRYQHLRANDLVIWKALEWYGRKKKYSEFSFGRTEQDNHGLIQFKSGWSVKEKKISYYKYSFSDKSAKASAFNIPKWQQKVLKKTPSAISRVLGSLIYRHIG